MDLRVSFPEEEIADEEISFAVIMAFKDDKIIIVRHQDRISYEIPGGHREENESNEEAARRELYEETGALEYSLNEVGIYAVERSEGISYGMLYYAKVDKLGPLPPHEIVELRLVDKLPAELTYPQIQPLLSERVIEYISSRDTEKS